MVSSLDGFIAKRDNCVSWFETKDDYEKEVEYTEEQTAAARLKTIDCYVMVGERMNMQPNFKNLWRCTNYFNQS